MTWLGLSVAARQAGCELSLLGARHAARLRGAISGKHKSDVIDADVLARAGEVFDLHPLRPVEPTQLALRRACTRRGTAVVDGNRHLRRLISLARWAFPDVWNGFCGSLPTAVAVLTRWPHLAQLAAARRSSLTAVVALHTRGVPDVPARVEAIRSAAAAWAQFWDGHLDLDGLAFDVAEHLADLAAANARTDRATAQAQQYWRRLYGDDELLLSVPGTGPITACHSLYSFIFSLLRRDLSPDGALIAGLSLGLVLLLIFPSITERLLVVIAQSRCCRRWRWRRRRAPGSSVGPGRLRRAVVGLCVAGPSAGRPLSRVPGTLVLDVSDRQPSSL